MFEKGFLEDEPILLDMVFRWVEITSLQHYLQEQRKGGSKTPNLAGPKILPFCNTLGHSVLSLYIYIHIYINIPGTQMTPVLIGKSLVLGGWPSKIGVIWVLGIYIYIYTCIYIYGTFLCSFSTPSFPEDKFMALCHTVSLKHKQHILKNRYLNPQHLFPTTFKLWRCWATLGYPPAPAKEIKDALGFLMEYREGSGQTLPPKFSDEKNTEVPVSEFVVVHRREDQQSKSQWNCIFVGCWIFFWGEYKNYNPIPEISCSIMRGFISLDDDFWGVYNKP